MTIEAQLADGRVLQFPDGTDPAVVQRTVKTILGSDGQSAAPERSAGVRAARMADQAAQGFLERGAELVTAPADLVWAGVEALTGWKPPGGTAAEKLKGAIQSGTQAANNAVAPFLPDMGPNVPETQGERNARAAGGGAADALGIVVPGGVLARGARAGSVLQGVGRAAAAQPGAQVIAGATGGAVTEATDNPWLGLGAALVAPGAVGKVAGRVASPVRSSLTPEQARLAADARTMGIPLTAGQATGSRPLRSLESLFGTLPMTAGAQQKVQRAQQGAFNREALKFIGETGTEATDDVLNSARQRIGADFENLAAQTTVVPDQQFGADLMDTVAEYSRRLDVQRKPVFENFVSDINDVMSQGGMPGEIYQKARSQLSQMAKAAAGTDPYFAQALRALRDTLDDAAERSVPAHLKDDWKKARAQWGNLRTLEKSRSNTTAAAAGGDIPATQLAIAERQRNPRGYAMGDGPMNRLSKVGTTFVRDPIPNSGTPERLFWQNLMTNPLGALGVAGTGAGLATDPVATMGYGALAVAGPRLAQMGYNSRPVQAWLKNQRGAAMAPQYNAGLLGSISAANMPGGEGEIDPRLLGLLGQ